MAAIECVVVGAGVVGLACARNAARRGLEVVVLEAQPLVGSVTSARNSEVVHAGIYYPAGSNKAAMCVDGREQLYAYCEAHGVPYSRCGKLIVATNPQEVATLEAIQAKARVNGVFDLVQLTQREAMALEPALRCDAALLSPSTGIIDSHSFMQALQGDAEEAGAVRDTLLACDLTLPLTLTLSLRSVILSFRVTLTRTLTLPLTLTLTLTLPATLTLTLTLPVTRNP
jgi:L-2-hydroxyglutarate oxidase LhgO